MNCWLGDLKAFADRGGPKLVLDSALETSANARLAGVLLQQVGQEGRHGTRLCAYHWAGQEVRDSSEPRKACRRKLG